MMDDLQKVTLFVGFCVACASGDMLTGLNNEDLIILLEECLVIAIFLNENKTQKQIMLLFLKIADIYINRHEWVKAIKYYKKCLSMNNSGVAMLDMMVCSRIGHALESLGEFHEAIEYHQKSLSIAKETDDRNGEGKCYGNLGNVYYSFREYHKAIEYYEKYLAIAKNIDDSRGEENAYGNLGNAYYSLGEYHKAIESHEKCLSIAKEIADRGVEGQSYRELGSSYHSLGQYLKAIEYHKKSLSIAKEIADKHEEGQSYVNIGMAYNSLGEYHNAIQHHEKHLSMAKEIADRRGEGHSYGHLGISYMSLGEYHKAIQHHEKSLSIAEEIADRHLAKNAYGNLGNVYRLLGEYHKAIEYHEKSLAIAKDICDRNGEGSAYGNLGSAYFSLGEYHKAIKYYENILHIAKEMCNRQGEGAAYGNLGSVYQSLGEYKKAIEYHNENLSIAKEIANRRGEEMAYINLGIVYQSLGEYRKAIEYHEKSLSISKDIGDRDGEGSSYGELGNSYDSLGEYYKAIEYHEKHLSIAEQISDRKGEGACYSSLGNAYYSLGEYNKAIEYHEKSLSIAREISDIPGEGQSYSNLGNAYHLLGEFLKAINYHEKSLSIAKEVAERREEGHVYGNLGNVYQSLGMYHEAIECQEKSLNINKEIGNKYGEGISYQNSGNAYQSLGEYHKAIEYHEKSLSIAKEIAYRLGEGQSYANLGNDYYLSGEYHKAIEYYEKYLRIATEIADRRGEGKSYGSLGNAYYSLGKYHTAIEYYGKHLSIATEIADRREEAAANSEIGNAYLTGTAKDLNMAKEHYTKSIKIYEDLFDALKEKDQFKISIVDTFIKAYKGLSLVYIESGQTEEALLTCERGRARALGDLLSLKYIMNKETTSEKKPIELAGVMNIASSCDGCILFCDLHRNKLTAHFWVVVPQRQSIFFYDEMSKIEDLAKIVSSLSEEDHQELAKQGYFQHLVEKSYTNMMVRGGMQCEDRSLGVLESEDQEPALSATFAGPNEIAVNVFQALTRCIYDEEEEDKPLEVLYARFVSPVQNHLTKDEIVIIPDGPLFMVPFAALQDPETGKFLSETKRIRLAPSLTTLKLIQESSDDHHYKSGALIVGNPATGTVMYRGKKRTISSLHGSEEEARRIGDLLGVKPLIGKQATKQAILRKLQVGVSVIHFATHGSEKNGQIILAPSVPSTANSIPEEQDYILTMKEAQESGIRAQLVVLSCCHSGRGEIKSEGVVGMARAFLAAGARSVVASLWAIDDEATKFFMLKFYSHLKKGETASKSLQEAMKEMRKTEIYNKPMFWAAFFLIGDDCTIVV